MLYLKKIIILYLAPNLNFAQGLQFLIHGPDKREVHYSLYQRQEMCWRWYATSLLVIERNKGHNFFKRWREMGRNGMKRWLEVGVTEGGRLAAKGNG
jgi:hypothetical protein